MLTFGQMLRRPGRKRLPVTSALFSIGTAYVTRVSFSPGLDGTRHRSQALAAFLAVLALLGAACGSSTSSISSPAASPASQTKAGSGGASPTSSPAAKFGPSVLVKDANGFPVRVSASAIKLIYQVVTRRAHTDGLELVAPPDQAYMAVIVRFENAYDRVEQLTFWIVFTVSEADLSKLGPPGQVKGLQWTCDSGKCRSNLSNGAIDTIFPGGNVGGIVIGTFQNPLPLGQSSDMGIVHGFPIASTAPLSAIGVAFSTEVKFGSNANAPLVPLLPGS